MEASISGVDDGFEGVTPVFFRLVEESHTVDANLCVDAISKASHKYNVVIPVTFPRPLAYMRYVSASYRAY